MWEHTSEPPPIWHRRHRQSVWPWTWPCQQRVPRIYWSARAPEYTTREFAKMVHDSPFSPFSPLETISTSLLASLYHNLPVLSVFSHVSCQFVFSHIFSGVVRPSQTRSPPSSLPHDYCSNLYLCSLWANYRKSSISRFIVSYNNAFRILHNLHMRCSASSMFANAVVDSCSTCIRKSIFSLMLRLNTSINVIVQSTLKSDVYTTSELYQRWVKALYT